MQTLRKMKSISDGGVLKGYVQALHIHVLLEGHYMAQPGTDQHEGGVAVQEIAHHTGALVS